MGKHENWKLFKNSWISTKPVLPGVWQRKEGGHVVRARVLAATTGQQKEIWKVLPEADAPAALQWLTLEKERVRAGGVSVEPRKMRFAEYATSLFARKVETKEIRSAKGRQKWGNTLEHLIAGTEVIETDDSGAQVGRKFVPGFGEMFLDKLGAVHIEEWRAGIARLIQAGDYAPTTCNSWLSVLRVILQAAKRELGLAGLATEGVKDFDESEHETYSEEEPNALLPEEVPVFLGAMRELFSAALRDGVLGHGDRAQAVESAAPAQAGTEGGRPVGRAQAAGAAFTHPRRRGDEHDEAAGEVPDPFAGGGREGPALARGDAARDGGDEGVGAPISGDHGRLPVAFGAEQAVRGGESGDRPTPALYPAWAQADVQRSGEGGAGGGRGDQEHLGPRDGPDARAVLDRGADRAAGQHREGDRLCPGKARLGRWGAKWGAGSREWGAKEKAGGFE